MYGVDNIYQCYLKQDFCYNLLLPEDGCIITAEACISVSLMMDGYNSSVINTEHLDVLV